MNFELFIARRILNDNENKKNAFFSVIKIAIFSISLGFMIMLFSMVIIRGFKSEIKNKVIAFGSHISIMNYDNNSSYETESIKKNQDFYPNITKIKGINHIQIFAIKAGIIKTKKDIQGIVLKGIGSDFKWDFFEKNIIDGKKFEVNDTIKTNKILISKIIANLLNFKVGDKILMYFIQKNSEQLRFRKFNVSGIYETGLYENDKLFAFVDIKHIQKLNFWKENEISGFEIFIDNYDDLKEMWYKVYEIAGNRFEENSNTLKVETIEEKVPQIFDWLELQNINVIVILSLMTLVSGFNMISGLLILIMEKTKTIGILKSLGATDWTIIKIFLYKAGFLIGKALFWGNLISIFLIFLQSYFGIIKLDPETYYLDKVPVLLNIYDLFILNLGTLLIILIMLLAPSFIITKISPVKTINFN